LTARHIIVVEDNPADLVLLREALTQQGISFQLEHYTNGEDAAKALAVAVRAPALILLDLNVPRIDGFELLRIIRGNRVLAHALVAIFTSSQAAADKKRASELGADAYVVKPPGYHEFVTDVGAAVARLLQRKPGTRCRSRLPRKSCGPVRGNPVFWASQIIIADLPRLNHNRPRLPRLRPVEHVKE
jgi:DNA-binding response OmpR family regulator